MNTHDIGVFGEEAAAKFFEERGFSILSRNFRFGRAGEIDLIVQKDDLVIFVEVKSRRSDALGGAVYAIGPSKKRKLKVVADAFLRLNPALNNKKMTFRFDLLAYNNGSFDWVQDILR